MTSAEVAAYIGRWQPSSVSAEAAAFARDVITAVRPGGQERAKNLLWAAGKLADYAIGLGLDPVPEVVLHPSVAGRFTRCAPGLSGVARRTLRTNLRFVGRRVVPQLYPQDLPLPRERSKQPYSPAEIGGYLALADAQPTMERRLGVIADWKHGPHRLTYRQTERTFGLVAAALAEDEPGGLPSGRLQGICDDLLEASVPEEFKDASSSLAVDWTDLESFSRPPPARGGPCADPGASWGHRKNNLLRSQDELFYGWYLSAGIMMRDENGPAVPEFARRATLSSPRHDPVRAFAPVLTAMPAAGIPLGDVLSDSGYAHR